MVCTAFTVLITHQCNSKSKIRKNIGKYCSVTCYTNGLIEGLIHPRDSAVRITLILRDNEHYYRKVLLNNFWQFKPYKLTQKIKPHVVTRSKVCLWPRKVKKGDAFSKPLPSPPWIDECLLLLSQCPKTHKILQSIAFIIFLLDIRCIVEVV